MLTNLLIFRFIILFFTRVAFIIHWPTESWQRSSLTSLFNIYPFIVHRFYFFYNLDIAAIVVNVAFHLYKLNHQSSVASLNCSCLCFSMKRCRRKVFVLQKNWSTLLFWIHQWIPSFTVSVTQLWFYIVCMLWFKKVIMLWHEMCLVVECKLVEKLDVFCSNSFQTPDGDTWSGQTTLCPDGDRTVLLQFWWCYDFII